MWLTQSRPITTLYPMPDRPPVRAGAARLFLLQPGPGAHPAPHADGPRRHPADCVLGCGAAHFPVPVPRDGPAPYAEAGQRIFFDLTPRGPEQDRARDRPPGVRRHGGALGRRAAQPFRRSQVLRHHKIAVAAPAPRRPGGGAGESPGDPDPRPHPARGGAAPGRPCGRTAPGRTRGARRRHRHAAPGPRRADPRPARLSRGSRHPAAARLGVRLAGRWPGNSPGTRGTGRCRKSCGACPTT